MTPLGYQQITDLSAAVTLTIPAGARKAVVIATTKDVRWRDDGTDPSSTAGMVLPAATVYVFEDLSANLTFIETAASAALNVNYYG